MKKISVSLFLLMFLFLSGCTSFEAMEKPESELLSEILVNARLYPNSDLPHTEVFSIEDFSKITSVGILTDWWQKRPTKIKVYEWENDRKGEMVGSRDYPHYLTLICGEDFLTQCSYPDKNGSATAQLLIPIETNTQKIAVVLDGLLSAPNKYVIFKGIRLYGFR